MTIVLHHIALRGSTNEVRDLVTLKSFDDLTQPFDICATFRQSSTLALSRCRK